MSKKDLILVSLVMSLVSALQARELNYYSLKVGVEGDPGRLSMKVFQVINAKEVLVEVGDPNDTKRPGLIWLKCATKGLTDGEFYGINWAPVIGKSKWIKIDGTKTYKTTDGTRTVFTAVVIPGKKIATRAGVVKGMWGHVLLHRAKGEAELKALGLNENEKAYVRQYVKRGPRAAVFMTATKKAKLALQTKIIKAWSVTEKNYRSLIRHKR